MWLFIYTCVSVVYIIIWKYIGLYIYMNLYFSWNLICFWILNKFLLLFLITEANFSLQLTVLKVYIQIFMQICCSFVRTRACRYTIFHYKDISSHLIAKQCCMVRMNCNHRQLYNKLFSSYLCKIPFFVLYVAIIYYLPRVNASR